MRVIATAGHVDHGKSTLVRALTGMESDRWEEERRRGLTIGLGFVWTELPGVGDVAFVDVPGHERFVPTMLAGIGPVPAVLFVVAADGGWMPQSTEHLAALDALGVRHGVLAVTRADLADPGPVLADATDRLARTGLGRVDAVSVSAVTGTGLPELRAALTRLARRIGDGDHDADVRLWIDRVFTISGAGTVVTGTLAAGRIRVGDELMLADTPVRVRGLQSLGKDVAEVRAVARVAVNLRGSVDIARGDVLLTPDAWRSVSEVDIWSTGDELPQELMLHVGSAAVPVRVRPLGGRAARLRLTRPLPLRVGDRVLLRDPGRHRIAAGADVLDVHPPPLRQRSSARRRGAELAALASATATDRAANLLRRMRFLRDHEFMQAGLPAVGDRVGPGLRVDPDAWAAAAKRLPELLTEWSKGHPLDAGMPVNVARQLLDLPDVRVAEQLASAAGLAMRAGLIRHDAGLPVAVDRAVAAVEADLAAAPFAAPDTERLAQLGLGSRELAAAERVGRLLRIAEGIVLLPDAPKRAAAVLATIPQPFTVSQARQALGTSRRVAVPLLELLDRDGVTEQAGDNTRRLG